MGTLVVARPRDVTKDRAILDAARALLSEVGYERMTMEAVAQRAHVGKPTVYRRWHSTAQLAFAATVDTGHSRPVPETGALRSDVRLVLKALIDSDGVLDRQLVGAVLGQMVADREFADTVFTSTIGAALEQIAPIWVGAVERGEVDSAFDASTALHDLVCAVHVRSLMYHEKMDDAALDGLIDRHLYGVAPRRQVRDD